MKICIIPIDNRPVCYDLIKDIGAIDDSIELILPPIEFLGDLLKPANTTELLSWLDSVSNIDTIILALDTIAYGGLIPSRRSEESFEEIKNRVEYLRKILLSKKAKIYAFSSIMRISNNNYNEEEKEYWKDYGKKIFQYSFSNGAEKSDIPDEIIKDYLLTRKRNFKINKLYLEWQKSGLFETLIFSKDDCAEFGFNVNEAKELEKMGGKTKTGADEIPLALLARSIKKDISIFIKYTEPDFRNCISNYEDISIEKSILGQLELAGFKTVDNEESADVVLLVNNFINKQGEHVMEWDTTPFNKQLTTPNKPYIVADVRYANGADNNFVKQLLPQINLKNFYGYAAWNTSANTIGSLLAGLKTKFNAIKYNDEAFKKLQIIRFLDDWAYQANIRKEIHSTENISNKMHPFEQTLITCLNYKKDLTPEYTYPWDRKFEIRITVN